MEVRVDSRTGLEELSQDECIALVARSAIGRLAVVVAGRPLVFPVNFTLDGRTIVFRTSPGTKLHGARNHPVAFECDGIDRAYHTGWSVVLQGEAEEVHGSSDIARLERLPLRPWTDAPKTVWLRVRPALVTGRRIPQHSASAAAAIEEEER
jgi:nitroimidazol reductase NimA-like FMN-containing flavoprotein (pyridoxamine 5'-phosphate oxidase superfamily)